MLSRLIQLTHGASWLRFRMAIVASLILSMAGVGLSWPGTNLPFEGTIYDYWLEDYPRVAQGAPDAPKLVIVAVDDQTVNNPRGSQPEIFSPMVWAAVLEALVASGVQAVAIHRALPSSENRAYPLDEERAWFQAIDNARRVDIPVIFGCRHRASEPMLPAPKFLEVMGRDNLGFIDLVHDRDDKVRRQNVIWPDSEADDSGSLSLAFLVAESVNPDVSFPSDPYYIDFSGKFTKISFGDLYERALGGQAEVFSQVLKEAVVVIGETSTFNMDSWPTPNSVYGQDGRGWSLTPAAQIQAHAIDTLLSGATMTHPGPAVTFLLFLGLVFLALTPVSLSEPRGGRHLFPWLPPAVLLLYPVVAYLAFKRMVFLPIIPGVVILALANLLHLGFRVRETSMMQRAGSQALNMYLNPALAGQIINNPEVLQRRGELRRVTVLFADLVGFTSLAESMDTASVVDILNRYFETMNTAIERYDGVVDKFMGDGIMAVWGAPLSQPLHAVSACLSALMQTSLMERLNRELAASGKPTLQALIGINTGDVIAGNIGASHRLNYTVMGDPVNLASRLVAVNKLYRTTILATEATMLLAKDKVCFRALDRIRVKGRKGSSTVYEVIAPVGAVSEKDAQCVNYFERALKHYWDRDFPGALARVEAALKSSPDDNPSQILAKRCLDYISNPPAPDWDGVTILEAK